jgi:hypothetical protein
MSPMKTHWLMAAAVLGGGLVGWTLPALSQPPGSVPLTNGFVAAIKAAANPDNYGLRADGQVFGLAG